ncbi:MAG: Nif3-like dinuclear metal center hexameric protein, partial [Clostridia bacterium]|nr:Nif3-like dinuclear metal center hexameric protein [Clostridia bacterium]
AGADMAVTHHPVIFSPLKKITAGSVVYELLTSGISAISAHTCWDSADGGVNDTLAKLLGFENVQPFELEGTAMARIAEVEPMTGEELALLVKEKLGCHLRLADSGKPITKVALCGGSASSLVYEAIGKADAFITGDLSHHVFIDAADSGMTVIAAGHFETENPSMTPLTEKLKEKFTDVDFVLVEQKNPVKYY